MADELELQDCLVRRHRLDRELLRLDDHRPLFGKFRGSWLRGRAVVAVVLAGTPLLAVTLDLALELVHELVDRGLHVLGGLARAQDRPLRPDGRLGDLVRGDGRVLLDGELELDSRRILHEPVELGQLVLGVLADLVADLEVPSFYLETHGPRI